MTRYHVQFAGRSSWVALLGQRVRQLLGLHGLLSQLAIACGVGLSLGVACLSFSPLWALAALAGISIAFATLKRPEIVLLGILTATSSIVFEETLPLIPIGVGSLHIPDLLILASLSLIVLRWLVEPDFKIVRTPLDLSLLAFWCMALLSTFIGIFRSSVEFRMAIRAIRVVTYYLTFFIVTNLMREDRQLRFLLRGLFLLGTIVAAAMVAQFLLGGSLPILPGRIATLVTQGKSYQGVTRIVVPGRSLLLVVFITATATLVLDRLRMISTLKFLQWGLLGLALILTFLRSYWVAIGAALFLLAYLARGQDRQRLIGWGILVVFLAAIVLLLVFGEPESGVARLVSASLARLGTLGSSETVRESSLQGRYIENKYALHQIMSHPLIGLGLGARYRPWDPELDRVRTDHSGFDPRTHMHNGHLWIIVKTGLLGYLCLMWLSLAFLWRGFKYWRAIPAPQMRGVALGFTLAYLGVLIAAVVNSTFIQWRWTPVIGIMMGINEVALRKTTLERPCSKEKSWQVVPKEERNGSDVVCI
jgi:O-antigen ligase